jgi:hypothetical protein
MDPDHPPIRSSSTSSSSSNTNTNSNNMNNLTTTKTATTKKKTPPKLFKKTPSSSSSLSEKKRLAGSKKKPQAEWIKEAREYFDGSLVVLFSLALSLPVAVVEHFSQRRTLLFTKKASHIFRFVSLTFLLLF